MLGTNRNEAVLFVGAKPVSPADYSAWAASMFGDAFQEVVARYPVQSSSSSSALWAKVQTEDFLICSTRRVAAIVEGAAYAYLFNHQPSFKVWGGPACRSDDRSEEQTSELQALMRISYAVFCLKKKRRRHM